MRDVAVCAACAYTCPPTHLSACVLCVPQHRTSTRKAGIVVSSATHLHAAARRRPPRARAEGPKHQSLARLRLPLTASSAQQRSGCCGDRHDGRDRRRQCSAGGVSATTMAGLRAFLPSWAGGGRVEEAPGTTLVPFGSEPAHSFCLSAGACAAAHGALIERAADARAARRAAEGPAPVQTVLHAYGAPSGSLQSALSSIQARAARRDTRRRSPRLTRRPRRWARLSPRRSA